MYNVLVNGRSFEIEVEDENWKVDGKPVIVDLSPLSNGHYHILHNNKGYQAELVKIDRTARTVDIKVNGRKYSLQLKDKFDLLLEKMGMNGAAASKAIAIKAPMPGLIVDLRIKAGDAVKAGDPLLVLEAMKMENILKAPGDGVVKSLKIKKGDSVEKGQLLIEF